MKPIVVAPAPGPVAPDGELHPAGALLAAVDAELVELLAHAVAVRLRIAPAVASVTSRLSLRRAWGYDKEFSCYFWLFGFSGGRIH
jgi:hypothetical protein